MKSNMISTLTPKESDGLPLHHSYDSNNSRDGCSSHRQVCQEEFMKSVDDDYV
jgi:hypothetical protein